MDSQKYLLIALFFFTNNFIQSQVDSLNGFEIIGNHHCELTIDYFTSDAISLNYASLPGNQAGFNHNTLWLWRSSIVPWTTKPIVKQLLPSDFTQNGSYVLNGLTLAYDQYIACYSLDSTVRQICACSETAANKNYSGNVQKKDTIINSWVTAELLHVSKNSLIIRYASLTGYLPLDYGNWFGIWSGRASPYNKFPALAIGKPTSNSESGTAVLNEISLVPGQTYTFMYFLGKNLSTAAVIIMFKIR